MKIASASASPIDIRLTETLTTSSGGIGDRGGLRLMVHVDGGAFGLGETAPIPGVEGPRLEDLAQELRQWSEAIVDSTVEDALGGLDDAGLSTLARFAVHTSLIDLESRAKAVPLAQYLRVGAHQHVAVNGLVTESNPAAIHSRVSLLAAEGVSAIKLKVGSSSTTEEVTRIIAASEAAGSSVELRLDANRNWDAETTERIIGRVGKHRISYIEDPTPEIGDYQALEAATGVRVAVDLSPMSSVDEQIDQAGVSVVVVKPAAVGGVDRVVDIARKYPEQQVVVTSSIDREIALAAAIHAAAALPSDPIAHGLSTGAIVRNMPTSLLAAEGRVAVPSGPGVYRPDAADE